MGKKKIVLDTNVLISAIGWGGPPEACLELVLKGKIDNFYSREIHNELLRVMEYPKFEFNEKEKGNFVEIVLSKSILVEPSINIEAVKDDPSDNKFIECALEAETDYIVTGDPHLLKMENFEKIKILNPKEFLEKMNR